MSYDEFREMFDHTHYDEMKAKFDPRGGFPEVYDKVCKGAKKYWEKMKTSNAFDFPDNNASRGRKNRKKNIIIIYYLIIIISII